MDCQDQGCTIPGGKQWRVNGDVMSISPHCRLFLRFAASTGNARSSSSEATSTDEVERRIAEC